MHAHDVRLVAWPDVAAATLVAIGFMLLVSLIPEPSRRRFMAIFVAGAGSVYLNGGLGAWGVVFAAVGTWGAYCGVESYRLIGLGWLMSTAGEHAPPAYS